jgi:hypothetical protein
MSLMVIAKWYKWLILLLCAALSMLWLPTINATPASAAIPYGSVTIVDLRDYCQGKGYAGVTQAGNNAYGWRCVAQGGSRQPVNMLEVCRTNYSYRAIDVLKNFYSPNPSAWECWKTYEGELGGVNLDGYCRSIGDVRSTLVGKTAYDWRCVTSSGGKAGIDMTKACRWQYNDPEAIDRVSNFYDPYSWRCWS